MRKYLGGAVIEDPLFFEIHFFDVHGGDRAGCWKRDPGA